MSKMTDADWLREAAGALDGTIIARELRRIAADLERTAKRLEEIDAKGSGIVQEISPGLFVTCEGPK